MSASAPAPLRLPAGDPRARRLARGLAQSTMLRLLGRRLAAAVPVMWGVTFLTFVVMNLLPGDAAQQLLGANATPAQVHDLSIKLGLTKPFLTRYGEWLGHLFSGNMGTSLASHSSVTSILGPQLPVTFELIAYAFVISLGLAVPLALLAARRPNGIIDRLTMMFSMAGLSIANYVLALVLVWVFADVVQLFPAIGFVSLSQGLGQNLRSLTLPAVAIAFPLLGFYTRLLRADLLEQMQQEDYVVTARAKGVGPWRVILRHALRNSLFGLITIVALNLGTLLGAVVIIETIFSLPGVGAGLIQAINNRDIPLVEATVLVFALLTVVANLLADILYSLLDPRIRYGGTVE
jgi:peptide/nickel transport system permease protein